MNALPLALHLVRSQVGDATLQSIDTSLAAAVPGVVAVLTAADLPAGSSVAGRPTLAAGPLLFQGQDLAAVVAEDPYIAADAAELVDVDLDFERASSSDSGDLSAAWSADGADCVVVQPRWHVAPLQTQQCLAEPRPDGTIDVHVSVRDEQAFVAELAAAAGVPPSQLRIVAPSSRGRAVVQADLLSAGHVLAVVAAHRLGAPARWQETRAESMTSGGSQAGFSGTARLSGSIEPASNRLEISLLADVGAVRLDTRLDPSWEALAWYGFAGVDVSQSERQSQLPPAVADGIEILGRVFLGDAAIVEIARKTGQSRSAVQSALLEAGGGTAAELMRKVESAVAVVSEPAEQRRSAVGSALAPGLAAAARVTLDDATGEWHVEDVAVAASFVIGAGNDAAVRAGVVDGYGLSSMQEVPFDQQGNCLAATLMDYVMPTSWEVPTVSVIQAGDGSEGQVGSDVARLLATAAVAQATRNAVVSLVPDAGTVSGVLTSSAIWEQLPA
jgi:CO/xanthine dehydrogenase Mo-binding subunit